MHYFDVKVPSQGDSFTEEEEFQPRNSPSNFINNPHMTETLRDKKKHLFKVNNITQEPQSQKREKEKEYCPYENRKIKNQQFAMTKNKLSLKMPVPKQIARSLREIQTDCMHRVKQMHSSSEQVHNESTSPISKLPESRLLE